jgi:hypothetical protein
MNAIGMIAVALAASTAEPGTTTDGAVDSVWVLIDRSWTTEDRDQKKEILRHAEALARSRLEGREEDVERRYALAAVLGMRANVEGGKTKIRVASELSTELEWILAADPDHAGARHMLGRLHAAVRRMNRITRWLATNLLGGDELKKASWEAAEENLLFAERHAPEVADHHLQLALLYRDTDRPELAEEELRHVMALQASTARDSVVQQEAVEAWDALAQ